MTIHRLLVPVAALAVTVSGVTLADRPELKNSGPIIHLADNLDEPDELGYCIDTQGRGRTERAQLHSCKPDSEDSRNRDVLFSLDEATGRIEHEEYAGTCLTVNAPGAETELGLLPCRDDDPRQRFAHDDESGTIHPADDSTLCLSGGAESSAAGPFMSRPLVIRGCDEVEPSLRTWVVRS